MAVYPTNQVHHFYLAKALASDTASLSAAGDIAVGSIGEGNNKEIYFVYKGKDGTVTKSDYIPVKNLDYIKAVKASDMVMPLTKIEIELNPNVNSGAPVVGQDYVLRIQFRQFVGMSDEDVYIKDAAVHVTSAMTTAALFFAEMKKALDLAFSREIGATKNSNPYLDFTVSGSKLVITEKPQNDWVLGVKKQERVLFEVFPTTIFSNSDDVFWAKQNATTGKYYTNATPAKEDAVVGTNALGNGKKIAELEWFCMGERGDQYRMKGWPNYIPTQYSVDPSAEYNVLEIHYAFTDTGVNSYRSEKDITIAVPVDVVDTEDDSSTPYNTINDIIDEIEEQTGLTIAGLADA